MKKRMLLGVLLLAGAISIMLGMGPKAEAFPGRAERRGYFNDALDTRGINLIPGGNYTNNVNDFVFFYYARLFNGDDHTANVVAAFTVLTMLNVQAPYPVPPNNEANMIQQARDRFPEWQRNVEWYGATGRINWAQDYSYAVNTYLQDSVPADVGWFSDLDTRDSIVFLNPDGSSYAIKKDCANPVGPMAAIWQPPQPPPPPPPYDLDCGGADVYYSPNRIPGEPMAIVARVNWSGGPGGPPTISATTSRVDPEPGIVGHTRLGDVFNTMSIRSDFTPNGAGIHTYRWSMTTSTGVRENCQQDFVINTPTAVSCGTANFSVDQPEVGQTFEVTVTGSYSGGMSPATLRSSSMNMSPVPGSIQQSAGLGPSNTVVLRSRPITATSPGAYTITWQFQVNERSTASLPPPQCVAIIYVLAHPYIDVNGGDVAAGAAFATTAGTPCAASGAQHNPNAGIATWNSRAPGFAGAGTDYAAFALNYIQEFATSRANNAAQGNTLSFANIGAGDSPTTGLFGGMFGSLGNCVDYWGNKPDDGRLTPWASGSIGGLSSGNYVHNGDLSISGGQISNGTRAVLYVNGDVRINGRIEYAGNGGWSRADQIPSFTLVVRGNIYITNAVNQLDGIYVAVPTNGDYANPASMSTNTLANPRKGTILTCAPNVGPPFRGYSAAEIAANPAICDGGGNQLTVNGSFIGAQLFLLRTRGTVSNGSPAEVFNFTPEVWLAPSGGGGMQSGYDAIVGLPPVL